jgi:hypothetical protein
MSGPRLILPLVYVAGPFAGPTNYDVQQNVQRAEAFGLTIARHGALPVVPHGMNRNYFGQLTEEFWLAGVMTLQARCDAAVFIPGWERSPGASAEFAFAHELEQPVFRADDDGWTEIFSAWVHAWKLRVAVLT